MESIDPFLWQLLIAPILTVGTGVAIAIRIKRVYAAPLVTLIFNVSVELAMGLLYTDGYRLLLSSWNIWLPVFSFIIAYTFIGKQLSDRHLPHQ